MKDLLEDIAPFLIFMVALGLVTLATFSVSNYNCGALEQRSGRDTEWYLLGGCYVEVNGDMIPLDNWRGEYEGSR